MTDKKLRSKTALSYNTGLHTTATSVIYGKIDRIVYNGLCDHIAVAYKYMNSNGDIVQTGAWEIEGADNINSMMSAIAPLLPAPVGEAEDTLIKFYTGFQTIAKDTWNNALDDWEIVDDIA